MGNNEQSAQTLREKFGDDYFKKIGRKGGKASAKKRGGRPVIETFRDPEKARAAANKRWGNK